MTPEQFAEQFEKARYESMLSRRWTDLREAERQTRTAVALAALTAAGLADVLRAAAETALRAEVFEGLVAQRDAEIARIRAEHAADLVEANERHSAALVAFQERHAADVAEIGATRGESLPKQAAPV